MELKNLLVLVMLICACTEEPVLKGVKNESAAISALRRDTLKFSSGICSIFQDSGGNYWFGSLQEGVAIYKDNAFTYFTVSDGLADNQVLSIQEDDRGMIWFETQNGVSRYDGITIKSYTGIGAGVPQSEWMKSNNDLWFGAGVKEGVYRYDGAQLEYLDFINPKVINPNNLYAVTGISKGKNDMLWIGTYAGVIGYNGSDFTIINDETLGLDIHTEPLHIRSILEDSKGRLWIGNNGIGVLLNEGGRTINFSEKNNLIHPTSKRKGDLSLPGTLEHVFTIAEDKKGNIWFGDRDAGIWKYDGENLKNYTKRDGLSNDFAQAIYTDGNGELWFGMADGNIFQFIGDTFLQQF